MDAIKKIFGFYAVSLIIALIIGFLGGMYVAMELTKSNFKNGTYILASEVNCTKQDGTE